MKLWFRRLYSAAVGVIASLVFYFFVAGDIYSRGIGGIVLGIFIGFLAFNPKKTLSGI